MHFTSKNFITAKFKGSCAYMSCHPQVMKTLKLFEDGAELRLKKVMNLAINLTETSLKVGEKKAPCLLIFRQSVIR